MKSGGGIDPETGYPTVPTVTWGKAIACQYRANKYRNLGKAGGEAFTVASYEILIDARPFDAEVLRLYDLCRRLIGEFSVIEVEPLQAVCQLRITV